MPWSLEIVAGRQSGTRAVLLPGAYVAVGKGAAANLRIDADPELADLHLIVTLEGGRAFFSVVPAEVHIGKSGESCRSGTLADGDLLEIGDTELLVHAPPPAPYPSELRIGSWGFGRLPSEWTVMEGHGLEHEEESGFRTSILVVEGIAPVGDFQACVQAERKRLLRMIAGIEAEEPLPADVPGADEAAMLRATSRFFDRDVLHDQIFALSNGVLGVLSFTRLAEQDEALRAVWDELRPALSFCAT